MKSSYVKAVVEFIGAEFCGRRDEDNSEEDWVDV